MALRIKKNAKVVKTKKRTKHPTDSEEEWDSKPTRKMARKKKKVVMSIGLYTYDELAPYFAKYDAICDNFKDYCKVQILVEWERSRDLKEAREKQEREAAQLEEKHIAKEEGAFVMLDLISSK